MNDPARHLDRFDPAGRREFPFANAQATPNAPERDIPAVITTLKERLEHVLKTSEHLRGRISPALSAATDQAAKGISTPVAQSALGEELQGALFLAHGVGAVLADILDRLQI
jgi:hypothetical protein